MRVVARDPDLAAFAPFGALIEGPALHGERRIYSDWLAPVAGLAPQLHVNSVARSDLPLSVGGMERHPRSAQVFVPLNVSRYLVTVMPADAGGRPDQASVLSMVLPGTMGVAYRADSWHAGIAVLDRDGQFAVLMWRGAADDDVFETVPPFAIHLPAARHTGTRP